LVSGLIASLGFAFVPVVYADRLGEYQKKLPIDNLAELRRYLEELEEELHILRSALLDLNLWRKCFDDNLNTPIIPVYPNPQDLVVIKNIIHSVNLIEQYKKCLSEYRTNSPQPPPTVPPSEDPLLPPVVVVPPQPPFVETPVINPIDDVIPMDTSDDNNNTLAIAGALLGLGLVYLNTGQKAE
jgi:hypothetical protein